MKNLIKTLKFAIILIISWFVIHTTYIVVDGLSDEGKKADIAIILGSKVNEDGTLSTRLEKRLETGIELYKNHRINKIMVSGGLGKEGFYEGDKMKEFLVNNSIPDSVILVDNYGNNTRLTVENTLKFQQKHKFKSIIVVSQYFHVTRTKKILKEKGFTQVESVSPRYFEWRDLYSILREFPAYYTQ
ncbi:YdcF family protein [Chryseobacterium sp. Ch-15]|uniref:YdcF family protein n=1 Tax=Chryseobacterium muglaense TaxID=2893752 RepID=A0A9Q3UUL5_9FLAO|nr:YdcF family protein [Chryseobacterium muglaense]MBD3907154.1 YdcF family protein [Chryseobacterium muglaense]MCC9033781.1 YdcF family protein [Chryseobacterium muglaense]MCM2556823.1 YdcF family protein [Chryseobacterium muglaense]